MIELFVGSMFRSLKVFHKKPRRLRRKQKLVKDKKATSQRKRLILTAARLRANPPKSEQWFHELFKPYKLDSDIYNTILGPYIPDVQNKVHGYVIEIDGSFHDSRKQKLKDHRKNQYLSQRGFAVIRIKAYDPLSFILGLTAVLELRADEVPALDDNTAPGTRSETTTQG